MSGTALRFQAMSGLWRRYRDVFRAAWAERHANGEIDRQAHEAAFLPAHLELMETPPHPLPRWTMRVIVALVLVAVLISIFGKLDIVVVASGELIPDSNVKLIQPAITGVVRAIHVHDGQHVNAGQSLIALDTHQAAADVATAHASRVRAALALARAQALLSATSTGQLPPLEMVPDASLSDQQQAAELAYQTWQAYQAKRRDAQDELSARQAELASTRQEIAKLKATAPLARKQANVYKNLAAQQDVTQIDYLDREQTALNQAHELDAQRYHAVQLEATIRQQLADLTGITAQFLSDQQQERDKDQQDYITSRGEETKAITRQGLLNLTAPVAGTVQQLAVHTLGGVVTTAQVLMEIVPSDTLRVKATIANREVGFVRVGQPVTIKVAAFPYTHYGTLSGAVVELADNATQEKQGGSVFVAYIKLKSNRLWIGRRWITLTPGMNVSAEIKTGKRRVISYFLSPLLQQAQESLRER